MERASDLPQELSFSSQHKLNARKNQFQLCVRQSTDARRQKALVNGDDLRDIGHGVLGETGYSRRKMNVSGIKAHFTLLVSGTQITVAIRLRFKASDWTISTGRRNPGAERLGAGKSAHQMSPCEITIGFAGGFGGQRKR